MSELSTWTEYNLIRHMLSVTTWAAVADCYIAMYTTAQDDDDGGTEVVAGNYARVQVPAWTITVDTGIANNTNPVQFPTATVAWPQVDWMGVCDASSAGNLVAWTQLDNAKDVGIGDTLEFAALAITVTVD
jgi:hypothetical protein